APSLRDGASLWDPIGPGATGGDNAAYDQQTVRLRVPEHDAPGLSGRVWRGQWGEIRNGGAWGWGEAGPCGLHVSFPQSFVSVQAGTARSTRLPHKKRRPQTFPCNGDGPRAPGHCKERLPQPRILGTLTYTMRTSPCGEQAGDRPLAGQPSPAS